MITPLTKFIDPVNAIIRSKLMKATCMSDTRTRTSIVQTIMEGNNTRIAQSTGRMFF